jgi:hypothetical protein
MMLLNPGKRKRYFIQEDALKEEEMSNFINFYF